MTVRRFVGLSVAAWMLLSLPSAARAQTVNGAIVGVVQDASGGVVPDVALTLRNIARDEIVATTVSGPEGSFSFRNLSPAKYEVQATKDGFNPISLPDVEVTLGSQIRVLVTITAGAVSERVEVFGGSSVLGTTATQEHGISPETLNQLPLQFGTGPRAAATFALLMPGVSTGQGNNAFDARINGGLQSGDEASVDGVSMQQGFMSQGGMVSILQDFPMSPDMVSEIKVLTSGYAPEYGSSVGGQIMAVTKSGSSKFHGSGFEFYQDASITATQWGRSEKPDFNKHNNGVNIGGPIKLPGFSNDKWKSFFYFDYERYRQQGGATAAVLSIPSMQERSGDFRDWRDANGNMIPIYDPATLRPDGNGGFIKDQFMGCDGNTPNVICPNRINPIVQPWLAALPTPTSGGTLNNFQAPPIPDTILGDSDYYMWRLDWQGGNDHIFASFWHQRAPAKLYSQLPQQIATETLSDPQNSWVNRMNWDRTFTPTLLNHMSMGYLNRNEGYGCVNGGFVDDFPKIGGVADPIVPPQIGMGEFNTLGCNAGVNVGNITTRPTFIVNDSVTWVKGSHTVKVGMEWRKIMGNIHANGNTAGTFNFESGATGLVGVTSGSPVASFLLGAVDNSSVSYRSVPSWYARQHAWIFHAGDSWQLNNKLTLDYGLRWDYYSPASEKYDRMSFFDPVGANPGAAGRPGRLAFAGEDYGAASYGARYPEKNWYEGLAPRLGLVYAMDDKTVIRGGWGIFYTQAFYPGWGGGMSLDGFSNDPSVSSSKGGIEPAMYLQNGFPIGNFALPPDIRSDYKNGQSIYFRNIDGNERPYSHQWNITVDRELGHKFALSAAYVGSAGRRMPSSIDPLNAINPDLLSMGSVLNQEFQPGPDEPGGRAAAVCRLGRADGQLRAVGGTGAAALPAVLRQPAGPERSPRQDALQLDAAEARAALLEGCLRAGVVHALAPDGERVEQHAAGRQHVERHHRSHLAVRAGSELRDLAKRYAARAVGGVRLRAAVRPRKGPRERRRRGVQRAGERVAAEHHLQVPVGRADVLPLGELQRARRVPRGLHPGDHQCGRRLRAGQGQFRSWQGAALQRQRIHAGKRLQLQLRHRQPRRGDHSRLLLSEPGLHHHEEHPDGRGHEPPAPPRGVQPVELALVPGQRPVGQPGVQH